MITEIIITCFPADICTTMLSLSSFRHRCDTRGVQCATAVVSMDDWSCFIFSYILFHNSSSTILQDFHNLDQIFYMYPFHGEWWMPTNHEHAIVVYWTYIPWCVESS